MKTTDGKEAKTGKFYRLEDGQEAILDMCATGPNGEDVFMVTPYYEGETMTVSGDGGSHHEYTAKYEHEGESQLVKNIFENAPLRKLNKQYAAKLENLRVVSLALGRILSEIKTEKEEERKLNINIGVLGKCHGNNLRQYGVASQKLEELEEKINEKRQKLSELEDSISDLKNEDVSSLVSKTELQRLNKCDFKMQCLEAGGVDDWDWYDESLKNFRERYPA